MFIICCIQRVRSTYDLGACNNPRGQFSGTYIYQCAAHLICSSIFFFLHSFICSSNRANGALGTYILNWLGFFVVVVWSFRSHHHSRYSQQSQCERARGANEPGKQRCTAIVVSPMLASPSLKSLITTTGRSWMVFARTDFVCILHNERQAVALHVHAQLWIVNTRWNWQYVKQGYHDSRTLYGRNWKFANV